MRKIGWVALLLGITSAAQAEFRTSESTPEALAELQRRCEVHSKNEDYTVRLLWGKVLQTRFKGEKVKTCIPSLSKPCERKEWYPYDFVGVLTHTNRHTPSDKVFFRVSGFAKEEMHKLDFKVGYPYAFCAEVQPRPSPQYPPQYLIYHYGTIYELK